jgi:hypothetical protein
MKTRVPHQLLALSLGVALAGAAPLAAADDIDIFTGASAGRAANPKILIVLDNTSNWARQSQQWPGGLQQGQSEARAISQVIRNLKDDVNVGLFEFVVGGSANDNGGMVRSHIRPMDTTNKASLTAQLSTISGAINSPSEKRNSHTSYGNLMYDVWNYFAGANSYSPSATTSVADATGYTSAYATFRSPLSADESCSKTYMIFIGNPNSSGPAADDAANTARLNALNNQRDANGALVPVSQLGLPDFSVQNTTVVTRLGVTPACYASDTAAAAAGFAPFESDCATYTEGCSIGAPAALASPLSCAAGTRTYTVIRTERFTDLISPGADVVTGPYNGTSGHTSGTYASAAAVPASDHGGMSCPANTTVTAANGAHTTTTYSCTYEVGAPDSSVTPVNSATTKTTTQCYSGQGTGASQWNPATSTDLGGWTCPAGVSCSYTGVDVGSSGGCGTQRKILVTQVTVAPATFALQQKITRTVNTDVATPRPDLVTTLGSTSQCYASGPGATTDFAAQCTGTNVTCTYNNTPTSTTYSNCPSGTSAYTINATDTVLADTPTGGSTPDTRPLNADEWARLMHDRGIPLAGSTVRPSVITYTIDVYNKQPNSVHTSLLMSMAKAGGGRYFAAKNEESIIAALAEIINEIQAINSTFASTSLPVNAANRSQNDNEVFIGMFRPDPLAKPRWFGNLKRFQLIQNGAGIELGDAKSDVALNPTTGFITPCARSYWTFDSGAYWANMGLNPDPKSECDSSYSKYSDNPDGPLVEKGGAAQILRAGNAGGSSATYALNRTMLTRSGSSLVPFSAAVSGLSQSLVDFVRGQDVNNEKGTGSTTTTRPSIHGDVIHSRPLPVNYGSGGVSVYYGANDGALHAVDAATGVENWSFVAPEFFATLNTSLNRLKDNTPLVSYPDSTGAVGADTQKKDYFFDGSIGLYQNLDNTKVWIYPAMRRGGRMLYALNVTNPATPTLRWAVGCPNQYNDTGCTSDAVSGIGQTWSTPIVTFLKGYSATRPVVIVGGGYDVCEDADTATPSCDGRKGGHIYIFDGENGTLLYTYDTVRAVAADITLADIDSDGYTDYVYAADTGGNLYRLNFVASPTSRGGLARTEWTGKRVAYTNGGGRKFLFAPAVLPLKTTAYLAIGSGDREHPLRVQYPYANVVNRFYVYRDKLDAPAATPAVNLDVMANYTSNTSCTTPPVTPTGSLDGWYMDLNAYGQGEQTVTSALIVNGSVTFSTNRPIPPDSASCATPLGEARGYWVSLLNASGGIDAEGQCGGSRSSVFIGGGLPPSPVMAQSVRVGNKVISAVIGAAQKGGVGIAKGVNSGVGVQIPPSQITTKRKRTYTVTSGD